MSRARLIAAATAAYLIALFAYMPAERLRGPLASMLPMVRLGALHGHPLLGRAEGARLGGLTVDALTWRWRPMSMFRGRFGLAMEIVAGPTQMFLDLDVASSREVLIERLDGELDLGWVGSALDGPMVMAKGRLSADAVSLALAADGTPQTATGRLRLENGGLLAPLELPIGSAEGMLSSRDGWLEIIFSLVPGSPLIGKGQAKLAGNGQYTLTARLAPSTLAEDSIHDTLRLIGLAEADGTVHLALEGKVL